SFSQKLRLHLAALQSKLVDQRGRQLRAANADKDHGKSMGAIPTEVTSLQLLASQSAHTTQDSEQSYESQVAPLAGALLFLNAGLTPARRSLGAGDARSGAAHLQEKGTDLAHVHVQRMVQTTFKRSSAGRWALHFAPRKQH